MAQTQDVNAAAIQDALRPVRQFISLISGAAGDQSWSGEDPYAVNPTNQFRTVGPNGQAVEGKPVLLSPNGALSLSPGVVMLGVGALIAWYVLK